ncbi:MAG: hypothetical protein IJT72_09875 [Lachnospiraceae bacterium]|nr:hypothetical protein [Lachnospiraceae bacterium]
MKKYRVGICDGDTGYVVGFMEYVNMNKEMPVKVSAFSGMDAVLDFAKNNRLDLLLLDENIESKDAGIRVLGLTDRKEYSGEDYIYKYQSVYKIINLIVSILDDGNKNVSDACMVYGIYSPVGRSGKTTLAKGICFNYKESIYLGFEAYSTEISNLFKNQQYKELYEQFMYYLLSKNVLILETLKEIIDVTGRRDFITLKYMDLRQIEQEHMDWLVNLLREKHLYKRVVFDLEPGIIDDLNIMISFDMVFVPNLNNTYSESKINSFKTILSDKKYSGLEKKIKYVEVPNCAFNSKEMKDFIVQDGM